MDNRPIKAELKDHQEEREKLCSDGIKFASKVITPDWKEEDVIHVIKNLNKKKSRDRYGYSNEIIQCGGKDVLSAVTKLMNNIKGSNIFHKVCKHVILQVCLKTRGPERTIINIEAYFE